MFEKKSRKQAKEQELAEKEKRLNKLKSQVWVTHSRSGQNFLCAIGISARIAKEAEIATNYSRFFTG